MSSRRKSRIKRGPAPKRRDGRVRVLTENTYRTHSKSEIERDFGPRCAFSMIHRDYAGGAMGIHIDHFDPTLTGRRRHAYKNLFPSAGSCNVIKNDNWPTREQSRQGMRFLNPCEEHDYGEHIFENEFGYLVATSVEGFYHIVNMGLNDDHFVENRKERSELLKRLDFDILILKESRLSSDEVEALKRVIETLKARLLKCIPQIDPSPPDVDVFETHPCAT